MARFTTEQVERQELLFNAKKDSIKLSEFINLEEYNKSLRMAIYESASDICKKIGIEPCMYIPSELKQGKSILYREYFERLLIEEYLQILAQMDTNDIMPNDAVEVAEHHTELKGRKPSLRNQIKEAFPEMTDSDFHRYCSDLYVLYTPELDKWLKKHYSHYSNVIISVGNVEGGDWYGKRFFDIPFAAMCEDPKYISAVASSKVESKK